MAFKKGVSGNPSGRPKDLIRPLAEAAAPAAFQKIVAISKLGHNKLTLQASMFIIERAYGKAIQQTEEIGKREERDIIIIRPGTAEAPGRIVRVDAEAGSGVHAPNQPA